MNVSQASCRVERFPREGCSSEDVSNVMGQDRACQGPGILGGWASSDWAGSPPGLPSGFYRGALLLGTPAPGRCVVAMASGLHRESPWHVSSPVPRPGWVAHRGRCLSGGAPFFVLV